MHDPVGVLHDPFEPVLGQHDRDAEVVHQPGDRREHLLGRGRVERRGRLVEHEHARVRREHCADRDPLLLTARDLVQRAVAQLREPEQVERLLDALAHHGGRDRELLHAVGELLLDGVGDETRQRILTDDTDDVGELARRVRRRIAAADGDPTFEQPAGEVRDETVDRAEERRLARTGAPDDEAQLAFGNVQIHVAQHRRGSVGVRDADAVEVDHAGTPARSSSGADSAGGCGRGGTSWRCGRGGGGATMPASAATRIATVGTIGSAGKCSGENDGFRSAAPNCVLAYRSVAVTRPQPATIHSGARQGSGR